MAGENNTYVSKYFTAEEIDQRLLQGYYDDAVSKGFTGSIEDFKNRLAKIPLPQSTNTVSASDNQYAFHGSGNHAILSDLYIKEGENTIDLISKKWGNGAEVKHSITSATPESAGVMSAEDKTKVNSGLVGITRKSQSIKLNTYTIEGVYNLLNVTIVDESPILNSGVVSARLTVLKTQNSNNTVITQVLNLNNLGGGEGNMYIRSNQKGTWKPWGKLQTNVEVGQVNTLDNLTDNGIYSGVLTNGTPTAMGTFYDTFVLIVINNYSVASGTGTPHCISQLKYSLALGGGISITKRTSIGGTWSEWSEIGDKYELPAATANTLGGIKLGTEFYQEHECLHINLGSGLMRHSDLNGFTTKIALVPANNINIGGVKIGSGIGVDGEGKIGVALGTNSGLIYNGNDITLSLGTNSQWEPSSTTNGILPLVAGTPVNSDFIDGKVGVPLAKDSALELTNYGVSVKRETEVKSDSTNPVESQAIAAAIEEGEKRALRRLFVAAGATYNESTGNYELNGIADLTESDMIYIYEYKNYHFSLNTARYFQENKNVRTIFPMNTVNTVYDQLFKNNKLSLVCIFMNSNFEVIKFSKSQTLEQTRGIPTESGSMSGMFTNAKKLKTVYPIDVSAVTSIGASFDGTIALIDVRLCGLKCSAIFKDSTNISKESVLYMMQYALPTSAIAITLHPDAYSRLADDTDIVAALEEQPLVSLVSA